MKQLIKKLTIALKGAAMGAADVIPGVSGGTIAFMTGIYDTLLSSINAIDKTAVKLLFTGKFKEFWKHINGGFLLSLFIGIGFSILSLAKLMTYLLHTHPIETWAFFFGLIVASSVFILKGIEGWKIKDIFFVIGGIALGVTICTLSPTNTPDDLWFIFISGAIAICAMILPGISGSFILLILGKYEYVMGCIKNLIDGVDFTENLLILCVFGVGAVVGILSFSKFLHWLLGKFHKQTILVLAGFIIGSLVKVWPWSNPEAIVKSQFPNSSLLGNGAGNLSESVMAAYEPIIDYQIGGAILFALIGFTIVTALEILSSRRG